MTARRCRHLLPLAAALMCGACGAASDGGAVLFDDRYVLETFATDADGIASPDGLAWDGASLVVADEGGSAIRRIGPRGTVTLADERSGLISPEDLAIGFGGSIYFSDDSAGGVWEVRDGGARRVHGSRGPTEGLAWAPDGRLLVGEPNAGGIRVYLPGSDDALQHFPDGAMAKPESMAFDAAGNLYVADNEDDVLYRFDGATGERSEAVRREGFSPESIAAVGDGLWVTDSHNGKLYRLDARRRLETVALFAGTLANLAGVTGDPQGNIYVAIQSDLEAGEGLIVILRRNPGGGGG